MEKTETIMDGKSREELCKYTRLYKGENMPPCIGGHTMYYWDSERFWVESQLSPELRDKEFIRHFPQDIGVIYQNYLQDFQKVFGEKSLHDDIPIGLQAILMRGIIGYPERLSEYEIRLFIEGYFRVCGHYEQRRSEWAKS